MLALLETMTPDQFRNEVVSDEGISLLHHAAQQNNVEVI
jgi:hypothetical protein